MMAARLKLLVLTAAMAAGAVPVPEAEAMMSYEVDLPDYIVRFSLPEDVASAMRPDRIERVWTSVDPDFQKAGYRDVLREYHAAYGWFGIELHGMRILEFSVIRRRPNLEGTLDTLDGLEDYTRRRMTPEQGYRVDRVDLSGRAWIRSRRYTLDDLRSDDRRDALYYICPLTRDYFFQTDVAIIETAGTQSPGRRKKWGQYREAILASLRVDRTSPSGR